MAVGVKALLTSVDEDEALTLRAQAMQLPGIHDDRESRSVTTAIKELLTAAVRLRLAVHAAGVSSGWRRGVVR